MSKLDEGKDAFDRIINDRLPELDDLEMRDFLFYMREEIDDRIEAEGFDEE